MGYSHRLSVVESSKQGSILPVISVTLATVGAWNQTKAIIGPSYLPKRSVKRGPFNQTLVRRTAYADFIFPQKQLRAVV